MSNLFEIMSEETNCDVNMLCDIIRSTAYDIHVFLGNGHLEKVYENALVNRLKKLGVNVIQQAQISVFDEDGTNIGDYYADLFIEKKLLIELKATKYLVNEHIAQILGYMRASHIEHGLLINFGSYKFEMRKFIL